MIVMQCTALAVTMLSAPAVVLSRDPRRQVLTSGIFGLSLVLVFLAFRAPDVALSQIVVGVIAMPVMILLALRRISADEEAR